ncbi:MAG: prepilin-type N-terminal cleavage/methylation domain-containing protein [Candidatus Paceibacteria bacterium]|jgi:prepilin-type N-terminal cleavage/methylation domain-containing protein
MMLQSPESRRFQTEDPLRRRLARRAGFTLIELLAVILIIGVLATFLLPKIPEAIDQAEVTGCRKNMSEIHTGLLSFKTKFKRLPRRENSGVRFFAILVASGTWEDTRTSAEKLTCPGVDYSALSVSDLPMEEWYKDLDLVDGSYSAYAGRDLQNYPLRSMGGKDVLVADDNDGGKNHRTTTNVLYGDGAVRGKEVFDLHNEGLMDEEEDLLVVGPESPLDELQVLSLD